jgi:sigma-B regulation protein RsbU (phosphoserine phosphatase)
MKRWSLLVLIVGWAAQAQTLPWIDISGPWRYQDGADDPRFAAPDFDDSGWATRDVPQTNFLQNRFLGDLPPDGRFFWLRRQVDLPADLDRQDLSLTVGKLTENYQVFVNGKQIGQAGNFDREESQLARPRTFDLPAVPAGRMTIAIRAWVCHCDGSTTWRRFADPGPWLISGTKNAPRTAGMAFLDGLRALRTSDVIAGVALATLALIVLLMYLNQRSQFDVLWLALYGFLLAYRRLIIVSAITENSTPWSGWNPPLGAPLNALLLEFVLARFPLRSRPVSVAIRVASWALTVVDIFDGSRSFALFALEALVFGVFVWLLARREDRSRGSLLLLASGMTVFLFQMLTDNSRILMNQLVPILRIGPYEGPPHPMLAAVFLLGVVLSLTRRALSDGVEKQRMAGELEAARTVQGLLVSNSAASIEEYSVESSYSPAHEVGGDFYYVLDGRLLVIGDVSGKGLKAAMMVSLLVGVLRDTAKRTPAAVLGALNRAVAGQLEGGFITCCCARFEPGGVVAVANAGHLSPYLDGREIAVEASLPLGVDAGVSWKETRLVLPVGSTMTFLSDGVVEAENAKGELFGFERTQEISGKSAQEIADAAKAWGQDDDITVVTVRRVS